MLGVDLIAEGGEDSDVVIESLAVGYPYPFRFQKSDEIADGKSVFFIAFSFQDLLKRKESFLIVGHTSIILNCPKKRTIILSGFSIMESRGEEYES